MGKILDELDEEHIFSVSKTEDGRFEFTESCDVYHSFILSAEDVKTLAYELLNMADKEAK